jgi:hypothetical protein
LITKCRQPFILSFAESSDGASTRAGWHRGFHGE